MEHQFNTTIAKKYGVDEAILLHNLNFWIIKNEANNKHFYDGRFWTYNSMEAFTKLFPYWTKRQVERILNSLIDKGLIVKGNYNKISYDRTSWYALTETVKSIYANGDMEERKTGNGSTQTVSPIPDSKPFGKPDEKPDDTHPTAFSMYRSLLDLGAEKNLINDWLKVRRTKKSTDTQTALNGFLNKVEKSGMELNDVLTICIENSWAGFDMKWLNNDIKGTQSKSGVFNFD